MAHIDGSSLHISHGPWPQLAWTIAVFGAFLAIHVTGRGPGEQKVMWHIGVGRFICRFEEEWFAVVHSSQSLVSADLGVRFGLGHYWTPDRTVTSLL